MHQKRSEVTVRIPLPRKGTTYVVRSKGSLKNSVPIVVAIRDMLKLAKTTREVKSMIHNKLLKINDCDVKDFREPIYVLNILKADKNYFLTILPTGRFVFEETTSKDRPCKIINKKMLKQNKTQINFHDGSNILTTDKFNTQDTVYLDFQGKQTKYVSIEKGKSFLVISGKYLGKKGKIESVDGSKLHVKIDNVVREIVLDKRGVIVL